MDNDSEKLFEKRIKRSNTRYISSKNQEILGIKLLSQKGLFFPGINEEKEEDEEKKGFKNNFKSNKQLVLLEKFKDSLNVQLEKAKK